MNVTIYRILQLGAKSWPPHAGDRMAQRASIREALQTVRWALASNGGHVHIGRGGVSVIYTRPGCAQCRLSGYSLRHCFNALAAMAAGVAWIDTRAVEDIGALVGAPMIACGTVADPPPWNGFSHAPRAVVFAWLRRHGAVTGGEPDRIAKFNESAYSRHRRSTA